MALQAVWSLCRVLPRLWLSVCSSVVDTSVTAPNRTSTSLSTPRRVAGRQSVGAEAALDETALVTGASGTGSTGADAGLSGMAALCGCSTAGSGGGSTQTRRGLEKGAGAEFGLTYLAGLTSVTTSACTTGRLAWATPPRTDRAPPHKT